MLVSFCITFLLAFKSRRTACKVWVEYGTLAKYELNENGLALLNVWMSLKKKKNNNSDEIRKEMHNDRVFKINPKNCYLTWPDKYIGCN